MTAQHIPLDEVSDAQWIDMGNFEVEVTKDGVTVWKGWAMGWQETPTKSLVVQGRYVADPEHAFAFIAAQFAEGCWDGVVQLAVCFDIEAMERAQAQAEADAAAEEARAALTRQERSSVPHRGKFAGDPPGRR
jgi:hypothetical protein